MRRMSLFGGRQPQRAAGLVVGMLFASVAAALPVGELIQNGGFQNGITPSLASWSASTGVNARAANNSINTSGGNAGFDRFFEDAFAVLGDDGGNIAGSPNAGISSISQSFILPAMLGGATIGSYDLTIRLDSVFDGDDSSIDGFVDIFDATLVGGASSITLFSQNSGPLPDCDPATTCTNDQLMNDPFTATLFGLSPGIYTLTFMLSEMVDIVIPNVISLTTNTAAGIDNVSVTGFANPIPEPGIVLLSGLGLVLLGAARRRSA